MKEQLEVGDIIYETRYGYVQNSIVIDRVTAKRAYSKHVEFERDCKNGLRERGRGTWNSSYYYLPTEKLENELKRKLLLEQCTKIQFVRLSNEEIEAVLNIYSNRTNT